MAGKGPAPKVNRRNKSDKPIRGEWKSSEGEGWQYGEIPAPPDGLKQPSLDAWNTWFRAWFAAHWTPDDLPGLRQVIRLYDQLERDEFQRATELRLSMDNYGITPKGQQDRRWVRPTPEEVPSSSPQRQRASASPYAHLKVVND
jgi:hypothetical protein